MYEETQKKNLQRISCDRTQDLQGAKVPRKNIEHHKIKNYL